MLLPGSRIVEPFRILCETCHSRLKIRSPEVIGEIHACPKCGSMVHIIPPAGWQEGAVLSSGESTWSHESALTASATASLVIPASAVAELSAPAAAASQLSALESPTQVLPVAAATSYLLHWVVGGVGMLLVGGLALVVWPRGGDADKPSPVAAAAEPKELVAQSTPTPAPKAPAVETDKPNPAPTALATNNRAAETATAESEPANSQPSTSPPPRDTKPAVKKTVEPPAPAPIAEPAPPSTVAKAPKSAEPAAKNSQHTPVLKFDPLDFDPDRLNSSAKSPAVANANTSSIPPNPPVDVATDPAAANAAAVGATLPVAGNAAPSAAANPTITSRRGQPAGEGPAATKPGQPATPIKAFQAADMPMLRLIETLSEFAGSGITLDPFALERAGVSPRMSVSVNSQDVTLAKILQDVLAPHHLEFVEQGGQTRVVLANADERRTFDYDVNDLSPGADATATGQLIQHFVAPESWKSNGGAGTIQVNGGTLHIEQSDSIRRQVIIFCERLRLARGGTLRSKYPAALLSVDSPYRGLASKLDEHTTFTFLAWTRLADVVRQLQEMSGLTILVDWAALAETEFGPASPVACSAVDRTWEDSLDGILEPLGLSWWAVDGATIQITSQSALDKIQRIEFYQLLPKLRSQFASSDALVDSIQKEIAKQGGKHNRKDVPRIKLDEPAGRLIVLAAPATHRHLSHRLTGEPKR